ncbi:MAG: C40 family peptidase [Schaedlerella sp.]
MKVTHVRRKVMLSALAGAIMIPGSVIRAKAADSKTESTSPVPVAGIESVLTECLETNVKDNIDLYLIPTKEGEYLNRAFSNVKDFSYVRNAPNEESEWTGKLYDDSTVTVLEYKGDWTKIRSGNVQGYVPADALYTGDEAKKHAKDYETDVVTVLADVLNVRSGQGTENEILTQVMFRQQYEATGEPVNGWYPVKVDGFDGWVCGEYVEAETTFSYAESKEEEEQRLALGETDPQVRGTIRTVRTGGVAGNRIQRNGTAETRTQGNGTDTRYSGSGAQAGNAAGAQSNETHANGAAQSGSEAGIQANGASGAQSGKEAGIQANGASGAQSGNEAGIQANGVSGAQSGNEAGIQANGASGVQSGSENGIQANETAGTQANGAQTDSAAGGVSVDSMGRPQFDGNGMQGQGTDETRGQADETQQADGAAEAQEAEVVDSQQYAGQAVIDFACQFIGNPYVWGGTSLTNGADCSGFVQSVYANFGISLPRTTYDMVNVGYEVSYDQALPGDLVLYDGHVGLYMGDGTIVNAMNEAQGIGICTATYAPIVTIRRVL